MMAHVLPPESDPAMDDQPCPSCKGMPWGCEWIACDECDDGQVYEDEDPFMDDDADEWGGVYRTCRKCEGLAGWCVKDGARRSVGGDAS